jgi:Fur family ferric uptake transcriptional regulator
MATESQELRKAGLKVTLPRVKIYQMLEQATEGDHWSAEDIYKLLMEQGEDVGLATVYRVLTQFEAAGPVFELATESSHDHIVCIKSGRIKEFNDPMLNKRLEEIAAELGYELTSRTVYLYGVSKD